MHRFDKDIALIPGDAGHYKGVISSNWSINKVPNGGYLMACIAKTMLQAGQMQSTPIVTANFLKRCEPGEATIAVERMSQSRQFERFEARLQQDGQEKSGLSAPLAAKTTSASWRVIRLLPWI